MKSFTITTLGCKVNRYESEAISEQLIEHGWYKASNEARANLCIVNTCTVTGKAALQSRQAARRLIRKHPGALVLVTGCYAQVAPEVFAAIDGVNYIVGNGFKDRIASLVDVENVHKSCLTVVEDLTAPRPFEDLPVTRFGNRTRPFLKIQDGCNNFCAYCIIPYARGRSRSLAPQRVVQRVKNFKNQGYNEVVLCGINLGRYGSDLNPKTSLSSLIELIENQNAINRLRLSSIEPDRLSEGLIRQLSASENFCPHLHIPLQSGDDEVLKHMNRHYSSQFYADLIHHISSVMPDVAIGVDVLVGFPTENEKAFENTCNLIKDLPIAYLHVFPFSRQKGTRAETIKEEVRPEIIKKRCQYVRKLGDLKRRKFYERHVGSVQEVLIEGKRDRTTGHLKGFTRNYIPVLVRGEDELLQQLIQVRLSRIKNGRVFGQHQSSQ